MSSEFRVFASKGFQIKFENGYEISCMFGLGNYCERRDNAPMPLSGVRVAQSFRSQDCEIAIFDPDGKMVDWKNSYHGVAGWQDANNFLEAINWIQEQNFSEVN